MLRPLYSTSIIIFFNVIHYYNLLKLIKITDVADQYRLRGVVYVYL